MSRDGDKMRTMTKDESAEMTDRRSNVDARRGPDAEQVEARQGDAGHEKRAREIESAMQETPVPAGDHKTQLRARVEARLGEMAAALVQLGGDAAYKERARDVEVAMQAAQGSMSGGWERVGEMEAAQLSHWLESTRNIGATPFPCGGSHE
jgi:hypothetical protein